MSYAKYAIFPPAKMHKNKLDFIGDIGDMSVEFVLCFASNS